jgi:hypothetical protein
MNRLKIIGLAIPFFYLISCMVFVSVSLGGMGFFTDSGQSLGSSYSYGVALGDLDGDGDLDAFVANANSQANKVYENVKVCRCDLNEDGRCDMLDWLLFGEDWGETGCELNQIP